MRSGVRMKSQLPLSSPSRETARCLRPVIGCTHRAYSVNMLGEYVLVVRLECLVIPRTSG
jgi:hypothetical protein